MVWKLENFIKKQKCISYFPKDLNEELNKVFIQIFYSHAKKGANVEKFFEALDLFISEELNVSEIELKTIILHAKLKKYEYLLRHLTQGSKVKLDKKILSSNDCEITKLDFKTKVRKGEADNDSDFEEDPDYQFYATVECPKEVDAEKLKRCIMKMLAQ